MSLPRVKTDPGEENRVRAIPDKVSGRSASRSRSACGRSGDAGATGVADGACAADAEALAFADGAAVPVGATDGRGDRLDSASWFGFRVGEAARDR